MILPVTGNHPGISAAARWQHFRHDSDIGIRGTGPSRAEAFEQAAMALTAVITDLRRVRASHTVEVRCRNADRELLFVDWIDAVVYEMYTRKMLFSDFRVEISGSNLLGSLSGEPINVARHQPVVEVKGATLSELQVRQTADGQWHAQCIVDV